MSLQLIKGRAGAGKSHYLYKTVISKSLKHPEREYFVIVPEQFTMQTQKDLVSMSPKRGIMNIDVLSFNRLAHRVFSEVGESGEVLLDEVGKSFVLRKVAGAVAGKMRVLGSSLSRPGFIKAVKDVISEFSRYEIKEEEFSRLMEAAGESGALSLKLSDIGLIYGAFNDYLEGKYITGDGRLDALSLAIPKSKMLKGSTVVLDGFVDFSPVQNVILRELMLTCRKVAVTVTASDEKRDSALFGPSRRTENSLIKIAGECRVPIDEPVTLYNGTPYRFRESPALSFLESHIFRYSSDKYEDGEGSDRGDAGDTLSSDRIRIVRAETIAGEMDFIAQSVRRAARTKRLRYRDMAVIVSDMDKYAPFAEKAFADYDIPVFTDQKKSVLFNPFIEYLRALIAMAEENFSYESVFRYLRTGFSVLTGEETDKLDNYCIAMGVRGYKKWREKWQTPMKGEKQVKLEEINDLREKFIKSVGTVTDVLKSRHKTVAQVTAALHEHFLLNNSQQKLHDEELRFAARGDLSMEKEYAQIYRIVIDVFDQLTELLGDERVSLKEYRELLDAGLSEAKVGIVPLSADRLVIGDISRSRIKDVKALFFAGVNDKYIPGNLSGGGLLSDNDRIKLAAGGVRIAPGSREKALDEKFHLYLVLTKPSESLTLTYSETDGDGKPARPAFLIRDILRLYPKLTVREAPKNIYDTELTPKIAMTKMASAIGNSDERMSAPWLELYAHCRRDPKAALALKNITEAAFFNKPVTKLSPGTAKKLYGDVLMGSVSRFETFAKCAFAHFLNYGLRLRERQTFRMDGADTGTLLHDAIERYSRKVTERGYRFARVPEDIGEILIRESVDESVESYGREFFAASSRDAYFITRLTRILKRLVWGISKQLEAGDFEPEFFEAPYDLGVTNLKGEAKMRVRGKIDRIDICEDGEKVYVKVVDYKTGSPRFDLTRFYYGVQMQLVIYMKAALNIASEKHAGKISLPAGLCFQRSRDMFIPRQKSDADREKALLRELMPCGLVNLDENVPERLDRSLAPGCDSDVIPVSVNKDGRIAKKSSVVSGGDMDILLSFADGKMREFAQRITDGEADISPYEMTNDTGCKYCIYKSICGFDEKLRGYERRKLEKMSDEILLSKMREENEDGKGAV